MTRTILSVFFALSLGGAPASFADHHEGGKHECSCGKECKHKEECSKHGKDCQCENKHAHGDAKAKKK